MSLRDRPSSTAIDPAANAAAMLLRLGFAIFALVIPSATLMSRWVIVVLVPIGAALIIFSALLRAEPAQLSDRTRAALFSYPGLACLYLAIWACVSLLWTPLPGQAAEKLFKTFGVSILGMAAVLSLPQRMRATNLHLITIGVALGAVLILIASLSAMADQPMLRFPAATPERVSVLITVLGWMGAAWMLIKDRPTLAFALILLVFAAVLFGPSRSALMPMCASLVALALAWNRPEKAGDFFAVLGVALILLAPLVLAFLAWLALADAKSLWTMAVSEPVLLMTGRGFDAANAARISGLIAPEAPISLISELWYDLGLLGAVFLSIALLAAFRQAGRLGLEVAPAALASLVAILVFAFADRGSTQTWWFNGMVVFAIVLMSVERGRYRTVRPRARLGSRTVDKDAKTLTHSSTHHEPT
jgi:hypothetical protein